MFCHKRHCDHDNLFFGIRKLVSNIVGEGDSITVIESSISLIAISLIVCTLRVSLAGHITEQVL